MQYHADCITKRKTIFLILFLTQVGVKGQMENNCDNLVCVLQNALYGRQLYPFTIRYGIDP